MKNADGEEHRRRADKSGQCYKAAVITLTSMSGSVGKKAVAAIIGSEHAGHAGGV